VALPQSIQRQGHCIMGEALFLRSFPRFGRCGFIMMSLLIVRTTSAAAQSANPDRGTLQRLLVAEDARGKGAEGLRPIMDALHASDPVLRRVAVRAIGRLQRPDLAQPLLAALSDSVPAIRAEAAIAMAQALRRNRRGAPPADTAELSVARVMSVLQEAIVRERDDSAAGAMAEAMGRIPLADSLTGRAAERAIITRSGSTLNFGLAHGLYWLAATKRFSGGLSSDGTTLLRTAGLASPDTTVRRMAALALGVADAFDSAMVFHAFADNDEQVRRLSLAGAARLSPGARASLVASAFKDSSIIVRVDAVKAARAGSDRPDCAPLIAATGDRHPYVRLAAIDALGAACADQASAVTTLVSIIRATPRERWPGVPAWQDAAHAVLALSQVDTAAARLQVERFARSPRWQDRMYAANASANLGATPALIALSSDRDHNVREAAITGLAKVAKHDADSIYIRALSSDGHQVLLAAAEALNGSSNPGALPALLAAFDRVSARRSENARDPRISMLKRIGEMGSAETAPHLRPYLADFDTTIATSTAALLTRWSGSKVDPAPAPLTIRAEPLADIFTNARLRLRVTMAKSSGGGSFILRLFPRETPATVARIVRLARAHYYDGHLFQRVEPNFVIQGGGPDASEYVGDSTFMRDEVAFHSHFRGTAGISSRGRDTGDAQFFFNLTDNSLLDHEYTVLGQLVDGWSVMDGILEGDTIGSVQVLEN
jgi:cyclophilin family peptidyl-prolyl cis-trans isomerase/HEAT repeat protein